MTCFAASSTSIHIHQHDIHDKVTGKGGRSYQTNTNTSGSHLFSGLRLEQGGVVQRQQANPLVEGEGIVLVQVGLPQPKTSRHDTYRSPVEGQQQTSKSGKGKNVCPAGKIRQIWIPKRRSLRKKCKLGFIEKLGRRVRVTGPPSLSHC